MGLGSVTITGADESIHPRELEQLSQQYPFVEWGILISLKRQGAEPRYPSKRWREFLAGHEKARFAAHLCGEVCGMFKPGEHAWAQRVQFNGALREALVTDETFADDRSLILQANNGDLSQALELSRAHGGHVQVLCDPSGGRGVLPNEWPRMPGWVEHGYAGGINHLNITVVLASLEAADESSFWIDLESGARSDDGRRFDLSRVQTILELAAPFLKAVA